MPKKYVIELQQRADARGNGRERRAGRVRVVPGRLSRSLARCTPHEARAFFGLPYVKPMQDAMMARIEREMLDAVAAMSPDAVMKMWFQSMPENPEQLRETFARFSPSPLVRRQAGKSLPQS